MGRFNEDYKTGMRLLVAKCKREDVDYHKLRWLIKFSKMLSYRSLCYKFWLNVVEQERIGRIPLCKSVDDICYGIGLSLFYWTHTKEGYIFWHDELEMIFHKEMYTPFKEDFWKR